MSVLPSNWQNAFQWLRENWTDPDTPWAQYKAGFLEHLGLTDEAQDPAVAELFRRVDQEFAGDGDRMAALTDESRQHEFLPAPTADTASGPSDDEATEQGFSADHVQAQRLGLPYWDADNQRYLYYDEASQDWVDEPPAAATESQWDAELGAELPFASLGDAEVAQLFYADEVHPEFADAVAGGDITIEPALTPAVAGTISDE